jgi:hypothetical protein
MRISRKVNHRDKTAPKAATQTPARLATGTVLFRLEPSSLVTLPVRPAAEAPPHLRQPGSTPLRRVGGIARRGRGSRQ